jgi:hypothetical protein
VHDPARSYELVVLKPEFAVCRFGPEALVPTWVDHGCFWSVSRTAEELSIVCEGAQIPSGVQSEKGFSCLKVVGPLELSSVGVMASLAGVLAERSVSLLALSTFDTDYLLVRQQDLPDAIDALRMGGHFVHF